MQTLQQPELHIPGGDNLTGTLSTRVFTPVCMLDYKYYLAGYPGFYFIVRKDLWFKESEFERVCLYRENVVNEYLHGNASPFDLWISNDLRCNRSLERMHLELSTRVGEYTNLDYRKNR